MSRRRLLLLLCLLLCSLAHEQWPPMSCESLTYERVGKFGQGLFTKTVRCASSSSMSCKCVVASNIKPLPASLVILLMEEGWEGVCTSQAVLNSYITWLETRPVRQNSRKVFAIFTYCQKYVYLSSSKGKWLPRTMTAIICPTYCNISPFRRQSLLRLTPSHKDKTKHMKIV